jgi:hypothetical protein
MCRNYREMGLRFRNKFAQAPVHGEATRRFSDGDSAERRLGIGRPRRAVRRPEDLSSEISRHLHPVIAGD